MEPVQQPKSTIAAGPHESVWQNTAPTPATRPLAEDLQTDVVIVGGGIAGVTIAYRLSALGLKVVLLEKGTLGSGETSHTTAHLTAALDDRYYEIERIFGKEKARLAADSHRTAIDFIEEICQTENIDAEFQRLPGYLFFAPQRYATQPAKRVRCRDGCRPAGEMDRYRAGHKAYPPGSH